MARTGHHQHSISMARTREVLSVRPAFQCQCRDRRNDRGSLNVGRRSHPQRQSTEPTKGIEMSRSTVLSIAALLIQMSTAAAQTPGPHSHVGPAGREPAPSSTRVTEREPATVARPGLYFGDAVTFGHGTGRTFVALDTKGAATSVGVSLSESALDGLPAEAPADDIGWLYRLPLPSVVKLPPFDHVALYLESTRPRSAWSVQRPTSRCAFLYERSSRSRSDHGGGSRPRAMLSLASRERDPAGLYPAAGNAASPHGGALGRHPRRRIQWQAVYGLIPPRLVRSTDQLPRANDRACISRLTTGYHEDRAAAGRIRSGRLVSIDVGRPMGRPTRRVSRGPGWAEVARCHTVVADDDRPAHAVRRHWCFALPERRPRATMHKGPASVLNKGQRTASYAVGQSAHAVIEASRTVLTFNKGF